MSNNTGDVCQMLQNCVKHFAQRFPEQKEAYHRMDQLIELVIEKIEQAERHDLCVSDVLAPLRKDLYEEIFQGEAP